jgi:hypothetical protein
MMYHFLYFPVVQLTSSALHGCSLRLFYLLFLLLLFPVILAVPTTDVPAAFLNIAIHSGCS